jgi:hypothetical protein
MNSIISSWGKNFASSVNFGGIKRGFLAFPGAVASVPVAKPAFKTHMGQSPFNAAEASGFPQVEQTVASMFNRPFAK